MSSDLNGVALIEAALEIKNNDWLEEQVQKFEESGKQPKNDKWKDKYKGATAIDSELFEISDDWAWASADEICSSVRDGTHDTPKYVGQGIPLITSKNLIDGRLDFSNIQFISAEDHIEISKRSEVNSGDILYAMIGTIGNPVVVKKDTDFSIKNVGLFKSNPSFIAPAYLRYWLESPAFNYWLTPRLKGTTQKFAPLGLLRSLPIPLAPLEQQKRIVAKIEELFSHIDAGIAALNKAEQLLRQYRQSVLKAAVTGELTKEWREQRLKDDVQGSTSAAGAGGAGAAKLEPASQLLERILKERRQKWEEQQLEQFKAKGKMPKNDKWKDKYEAPELSDDLFFSDIPGSWCVASIDHLACDIRYGSSSKTNDDETGVPILRMGNIVDGSLDYSKLKYLPNDHKEFPALLLADGDLVFNRTNSAELVGKTAVYRDKGKATSLASYLIRVKLLSGLEPNFVAFIINSAIGKSWIKSCVSQNVGQANVNGTKLKAFVIPVPSSEEQAEIVKLVKEKYGSSQRLMNEIEMQLVKSETNKQAVLGAVFSGDLVNG